jgi:DNA-directed RNA polymerase subunit RPC12/RpoP
MRTPYLTVDSATLDGNNVEEVTDLTAEKFERCNYCNTKLLFTHDLNLSYFEVTENCRCPGCGVTKTPQRFTLQ